MGNLKRVPVIEKPPTDFETYRRAAEIREEMERDLSSLEENWSIHTDEPIPSENLLDQIIYLLIRRGVIE